MCVITRAKILSGATDADAVAHRLFSQCNMVPVSTEIADNASMIRQASRLKLPHALIAAKASILAVPLLSRDMGMIAADVGAIIPYNVN